MFESCGGDSFKAELKLAAMKTAVRKHGTSGNRRVSLFGTLVGWLHEQSYIPQVGFNSSWKNSRGKGDEADFANMYSHPRAQHELCLFIYDTGHGSVHGGLVANF